MQISVVILDEDEMRQAVALWMQTRMEMPVQIGYCKQVKSKHGRQFAVSVQKVEDAGCDSIPEEG